jgi:hypothetical protein
MQVHHSHFFQQKLLERVSSHRHKLHCAFGCARQFNDKRHCLRPSFKLDPRVEVTS